MSRRFNAVCARSVPFLVFASSRSRRPGPRAERHRHDRRHHRRSVRRGAAGRDRHGVTSRPAPTQRGHRRHGMFRPALLPVGVYDLTAELAGFTTRKLPEVSLTVGQT